MGLRGPAPAPTALKIIRGNPGKRALNRDEPQPEKGRPPLPDSVAESEAAKREWERLCPLLEEMGVLTVADGDALACLCVDLAALKGVEATLRKAGAAQYVLKVNGVNLMNVQAQLKERVYRMMREFGMTPSSRSAIKVSKKSKSDDWDDI